MKHIVIFMLIGSLMIVSFTGIAHAVAQTENMQVVVPSRVESDTNNDGKIDRWEYYQGDKINRIEQDTDYNGNIDEWVHFENGKLLKGERDTDNDGKPDTWLYY